MNKYASSESRYLGLPRYLLLASVLLWTTPAFAGGFAILEQSGRGLGQAFAGATTGFGDGSSVYYNPAAMTRLNGDLFHISNNAIIPSAKFNNKGSSTAAALGGAPLIGGDGGDAGGLAYVPNIYAVKGLADDKLKLGFAINAPYGLTAEYDNDWIGRYQAIKSDLMTVTFSPSVAYQVTDFLSIGAGLNAMYADAELSNAIDFGTIGVSTLGPTTAASLGLLPQAADGLGVVKGDDWALGYTVGALASFGDTHFGVSFKSKIDLELEGGGSFEVPAQAAALTSTGAFTDTGAEALPSLPESISFDVHHAFSDRWDVAAGAIWTGWSRLDELRIQFDNAAQADSVTRLDWNSTWRFAAGTSYLVVDGLRVRTGLSYEETPIADAETRTPRIPDDDRFWLTAGVTLDVIEDLTFDVSYAHLIMDDADTNHVGSTGETLVGDYDLSINILAFSLTWTPK